ncbi:MAG: cytochrome c [Sulfuricella sp.]|nr:cytochrome c [Sulfuricella sp.]
MNDGKQENELENGVRTLVYLDDETEPLLSHRPPVRFELDTTRLEDGEHRLRVEAYDSTGRKGVRIISFTVRNGPGIAVNGVRDNDVLEGKIPILINAYGGSGETLWEPSRAETPAPIPTWAWVLFIAIVAFGAFYGVRLWKPPLNFATTPTYGPLTLNPPQSAGLAATTGHATADAAPPTGVAGDDAALGASTYGNNCVSCHQATGKGLPGVFPPLAGNPAVTDADPTTHIKVVLNGMQGKTIGGANYTTPMPPWADQLSDAQIAAVINHERSSWGNNAPKVTAKDVAKLRAAK